MKSKKNRSFSAGLHAVLTKLAPFQGHLRKMKLEHARYMKGPVLGNDKLLHHPYRRCDARGRGFTTLCGKQLKITQFTLPGITETDWCPVCVERRPVEL